MDSKSGYNYHAGGADDLYKLERRVRRLTQFLVYFNLVVLLAALINFAVCIWIRFDLDFQ